MPNQTVSVSEETYFSPQYWAQQLGVSYRTVLRIIDRGELPAYKIGGQIRIKRTDAERYMDRRRTGAGGAS